MLSIRQQLSGDAAEPIETQRVRFAAIRRWLAPGCLATAMVLPTAVVAGLVPGTEAFGGLSWPTAVVLGAILFFLVAALFAFTFLCFVA